MGFKFSYLCDLLSNLEGNRYLKASTAAKTSNPDFRTISNWFLNHSKRIHAADTDLLALLSCLFPEKRPDRVYWLQHTSLARVIARCLLLGVSRREELDRWRLSGGEDLGQCVENVMRQAENQILPGQEVTVEEIDEALSRIASRCRFSGPRLRRQHTAVDVEEALGSLYRRLTSRDAKWLTRMILKSYHPVTLPDNYVFRHVHFLLPHLLLFQDSLEAAVNLLRATPLRLFPPRPQPDVAKVLSEKALEHLSPQVGIKIGRPEFYKARSIKHCCKMIGQRRMSLERKYDGEYCQIHIDLSNPQDLIRIFSKSGKDSTADRVGIHRIIKESLRIGEADCKFTRQCILEGEMLVWSDKDERILEFHKLRKFITRSGTLIGADYDSQPKPFEHLMIVFFDILLLDDKVCLTQPHRNRRLLLKDTIKVIPGRAEIAEQQIVDFSRPDGPQRLRRAFSKSIAERWEGYVLKACDEPYFAILSSGTDDGFCRWIKLKKDYIPGLGDTADFALIGARYDSSEAAALKHIRNLSWTHFYIGCLENKNAIRQFGAKPKFRVIDMIGRHSLSAANMQVLNHWGQFYACHPDSNAVFEIHSIYTDLSSMDVIFKTPFVVEVLGSGFDKPSNTGYFTLRFPRVLKIHWDRAYEETISFSELQDLAAKARSVPADEASQEDALWSERLKEPDGKSEYIIDRSQSTATSSPRSASTLSLSPQCVRNTTKSNILPALTDAAVRTIPFIQQPALRELACVNSPKRHCPDSHTKAPLSTKRRRSLYLEQVSLPQSCKRYKVIMAENLPTELPALSNLAYRPKPLIDIALQSPLVTIPMYCGKFFFTTPPRDLEPLFRAQAREFTFAVCHFVEELAFPGCRNALLNSNPAAAENDIAIGIVLIDDRVGLAKKAQEIKEVGDEVAQTIKCRFPELPSKGKIFFLSYRTLYHGTGVENRQWCLKSRWAEVAKDYFFACVSWGYGIPPDVVARREFERLQIREEGVGEELDDEDRDKREGTDVFTSWDAKEAEMLGEFVSIEPLVHITGAEFKDSKIYP